MVMHTVWFKMKDEAAEADEEAMLETLRNFAQEIDEVKVLSCGRDISGRSQGYEIGLVVMFESRDDLEIYGPHPVHKAFTDKFSHLWEDVKALDFETA